MTRTRALLASLLLWCFAAAPAFAQSSPGWTYGYVPTVAQWNAAFASKQDYLGAPPLLTTGGTMMGPLVTAASVVAGAGFNIQPGTAPTSPINGDLWGTSSGIFAQINGVTYNLLTSAPCSVCAVTNADNHFTTIQTDQGLTTTSPGWYAQLTGDAVPRVRVGLNSADVASIEFGSGSVTRDAFIERAGPANIRFGSPDAASPVAQISSVQNVLAGTSNMAGASRTIAGSQGTGTGIGGDIIFQVAPAGGAGSAQNALANALLIKGSGALQAVNSVAIAGCSIGSAVLCTIGSAVITGTLAVQASSASALLVQTAGGVTVFQVDSSAGSLGNGIKVTGSAAGGNVRIDTLSSSGNESLIVAAKGSGSIFLANGTGPVAVNIGVPSSIAGTLNIAASVASYQSITVTGTAGAGVASLPIGTYTLIGSSLSNVFTTNQTIQSSNANALLVQSSGGATALQVDASTASLAAGVKITGAVTGGTVAVAAIDSGSNTNLTVNAKGTGTIGIGNVSTGAVTITPNTTVSGTFTATGLAAFSTGVVGGVAAGSSLAIASTSSGAPSGDSMTLTATTINLAGTVAGSGVATANTANTLVKRDGSGNFSAGTITASLTGHSSLDLPLTGGTISGSLVINPTAASVNQGVNITQTSPTSGSTTGPFSFNLINVNDQVSVTTAGTDSGGLANTNVAGFRVNMVTGGANVQGQTISAGIFSVQDTIGNSSSGDKVGVLGAAYGNVVNAAHSVFGMNALVKIDASGSYPAAIGIESDAIVNGTVTYRIAVNATGGGTVQGSTVDAAFVASAAASTSKFKTLMALSNIYGFNPISNTGDLFNSDTSFTVANIFNMSNATVTGNIFNFGSPFTVTGAGAVTAAVSVTSPIYNAAGALTFQSNGGTFAGNISTGQQVLFGTTAITPASGVELTVSKNTGTPTVGPISGTLLDVVGANAAASRLAIRGFGGFGGSVIYYSTGGTAASPTQTLSGAALGVNFGFGYSAATTAYLTGAGSGFQMNATENYDATHGGANFQIITTPNGTVSQGVQVTVNSSGGVGIGTATDPGNGSLQINAQIFMPNITTSSAAQTGTVCWTTGTGKFTVDTTVGCLTSIMAAKNITERLSPAKALDIVSRLDPFAFRYKTGYGDGGRYEQFGLGAEEVALVDERLVGRDPSGTLQGVRYQEGFAVSVGAIQGLLEKFQEMKADNDNLRIELKKVMRK